MYSYSMKLQNSNLVTDYHHFWNTYDVLFTICGLPFRVKSSSWIQELYWHNIVVENSNVNLIEAGPPPYIFRQDAGGPWRCGNTYQVLDFPMCPEILRLSIFLGYIYLMKQLFWVANFFRIECKIIWVFKEVRTLLRNKMRPPKMCWLRLFGFYKLNFFQFSSKLSKSSITIFTNSFDLL